MADNPTVSVFDYMTAAQISDVQLPYGTQTMDVSSALQMAIDDNSVNYSSTVSAPYNAIKVFFPAGTYLCKDLVIYNNTQIEFAPGATLLLASGATWGLSAVNTIGQTNPTDGVPGVVLTDVQVDMQGANGVFGLLLQCLETGAIIRPRVLNVPSGTASYDDGSGSQTYSKTGIALKGIFNVGDASYTLIEQAFCAGHTAEDLGGIGIYLGPTPTTTSSQANYNRVTQPRVRLFSTGILVDAANDCSIEMPQVSSNTVGISLGRSSGSNIPDRTHISQPYTESCTKGMVINNSANNTVVQSWSSDSGTTHTIVESGTSSSFYDLPGTLTGTLAFTGTDQSFFSCALFDNSAGSTDVTLIGLTTAGTGTYNDQKCSFYVIDRTCFFDIYLDWSAHTGTGQMAIALGNSWPAVATGSARPNAAVPVHVQRAISAGAGYAQVQGIVGSAQITLTAFNGSNATGMPMSGNTSGGIRVSGFYDIDP